MKSRLLYPCIVKKEDGIFYANFLDFEGCFTDGETLEEVVINAKDVLSGTLFTMAKHNIPFPSSENKKIDLKDGEFLIYIQNYIEFLGIFFILKLSFLYCYIFSKCGMI